MYSAVVLVTYVSIPDTPWDQPTKDSPEFEAYLSGELLNHDPWTRLGPASLCKASMSVPSALTRPETVYISSPKEGAHCRSNQAHHDERRNRTPLVRSVDYLPPVLHFAIFLG